MIPFDLICFDSYDKSDAVVFGGFTRFVKFFWNDARNQSPRLDNISSCDRDCFFNKSRVKPII